MKKETAQPLTETFLGSADTDFIIAEWTAPGGNPMLIAPYHIHHTDDEAWYVLEGTLCVQVGDTEVTAPAGTGVYVPKGTPHTYWNPNPEPCRYLIFMTANIQRLINAIHAMEERTQETMEAVFKSHNSGYLGWELKI